MHPPNKKREALDLLVRDLRRVLDSQPPRSWIPDSGTMSRWTRADPRHDPD